MKRSPAPLLAVEVPGRCRPEPRRFRGNVPEVHDYQSDRKHLGARMGR